MGLPWGVPRVMVRNLKENLKRESPRNLMHSGVRPVQSWINGVGGGKLQVTLKTHRKHWLFLVLPSVSIQGCFFSRKHSQPRTLALMLKSNSGCALPTEMRVFWFFSPISVWTFLESNSLNCRTCCFSTTRTGFAPFFEINGWICLEFLAVAGVEWTSSDRQIDMDWIDEGIADSDTIDKWILMDGMHCLRCQTTASHEDYRDMLKHLHDGETVVLVTRNGNKWIQCRNCTRFWHKNCICTKCTDADFDVVGEFRCCGLHSHRHEHWE